MIDITSLIKVIFKNAWGKGECKECSAEVSYKEIKDKDGKLVGYLVEDPLAGGAQSMPLESFHQEGYCEAPKSIKENASYSDNWIVKGIKFIEEKVIDPAVKYLADKFNNFVEGAKEMLCVKDADSGTDNASGGVSGAEAGLKELLAPQLVSEQIIENNEPVVIGFSKLESPPPQFVIVDAGLKCMSENPVEPKYSSENSDVVTEGCELYLSDSESIPKSTSASASNIVGENVKSVNRGYVDGDTQGFSGNSIYELIELYKKEFPGFSYTIYNSYDRPYTEPRFDIIKLGNGEVIYFNPFAKGEEISTTCMAYPELDGIVREAKREGVTSPVVVIGFGGGEAESKKEAQRIANLAENAGNPQVLAALTAQYGAGVGGKSESINSGATKGSHTFKEFNDEHEGVEPSNLNNNTSSQGNNGQESKEDGEHLS